MQILSDEMLVMQPKHFLLLAMEQELLVNNHLPPALPNPFHTKLLIEIGKPNSETFYPSADYGLICTPTLGRGSFQAS
jgi:hypothetical protein